ncbi:MAG: MFS transporter [Paracoccus sp. (in: a-proteobacteria)]|nr:MFS transporter [Paracoccus sp. (in: a-proteobacteria)]
MTEQPGFRARVVIPLVVALALLMETTDATVLATALPTLSHDLSVPVLSLKLALSTYLISYAAMVPVSGWLADKFGARRIFVAAMCVFLAGSVLCAMQSDLLGLVLSRAVQGAGGAMMVPVGRLIVLRGVAKPDMVQALAWVTIPALIGPALGPLVGALVTAELGWRWIFLINLPIGALALTLALILIPELPKEPVKPLDQPGFILSGLAIGAGLFGLSCLGEHLISTRMAIAAMVVGLVALAIYLRRVRRRDDALVNPRLFRHHTFAVGTWAGTMFRISGGAAAFLLPLLFQVGLGLSIVTSGLISGTFAIGGIAMKAIAPRILDRFGFRPAMVWGTLICAAAFAGLGFIDRVDYPRIIALVVVAGFAQALVFTALNGLVFAQTDEAEMASATSLVAVSQQVGLTAGISVAALVLQMGAGSHHIPELTHFHLAFWVVAATLVVSAAMMMPLRPDETAGLRHPPTRKHRHFHWFWQ